MKLYDASILIIVIVFVLTAAGTFASYKLLGPNSPVTKDAEQALEVEGEALVERETGIILPAPASQATPAAKAN